MLLRLLLNLLAYDSNFMHGLPESTMLNLERQDQPADLHQVKVACDFKAACRKTHCFASAFGTWLW